MILVTAEINNKTKNLKDNVEIYRFLIGNDIYYYNVTKDIIYILIFDTDDFLRLCINLIVVLNGERLKAKFYISYSNERIEKVNIERRVPLVFYHNKDLRKICLKNKAFRRSKDYLIRASPQTLDSLLYSLSIICLKNGRNVEYIYDHYYNELTQEQMARKHHMTQSAVSKKLKVNNYEMFKLLADRMKQPTKTKKRKLIR